MENDRILNLHETASGHYLRGEYREAIDAWKALLSLDPSDSQAIEGVRLAQALSESVEGEALGSAEPPPPRDAAGLRRSIEEIDAHLEAGDEAGAVALAERLAAEVPGDPEVAEALERARSAQQEVALERGLSVLDSLSAGIDSAQGAPARPAAGAAASPVEEPSAPAPPSPDGEADGSLDVTLHDPSPAAAELRRRIDDLLEEAKREAAAGRVDEALSILSRVFILDEDDTRARALEEELRAARGQAGRDVESALGEGAQDFENGLFQEARAAFLRVLDLCPGHVEALDYLERIDAALEGQGAPAEEERPAPEAQEAVRFDENLLAGGGGAAADRSAAAPDESIPLAQTRSSVPEPAVASCPDAGRVTVPAAPVTAPAVRRGSRRLLLGAFLVVVLGASGAAAWLLPKLREAGTPAGVPETPRVAAARRPAKPAAPPAAPKAEAPARSISDTLAAARASSAAEDYAAAIVAYDEVLKRDPSNEEARAGLLAAGEHYKAMKAEIEQIEKAKSAFAEEEFANALRILYRVPKGRHDAEIETYTFNSWFNLGLVSLRAANFREAVSNFDEALAIRRGHPDVRGARDLAVRFQNEAPDRGFYDRVQQIPFRKIDD